MAGAALGAPPGSAPTGPPATPPLPPPGSSARVGALMLILLILLVFALGMLVMLAVRRSLRPGATRRPGARTIAPSPWSVAGKRARPAADPPAPGGPPHETGGGP
ncbi:MAG TPA: hypothetical protein DEB06_10755 [Phycisphaerales bacterium]|nr:hypothetical protein [Phycisphaerales bacterium]